MQKSMMLFLAGIFLLLSSSVSAEEAKQPAVLLQEALYAEEMEGDLEKAIGLYEQVIKESEKIDRLGAEATYRLGLCHLKKGDKEKAAEYLQKVVSSYPNQNAIAAKARQQLIKIKPELTTSEGQNRWGPIIEKTINDDGVGEDFMFDLDTDKSFSLSDVKKWSDSEVEPQEKVIENFIVKSGVDLIGETSKKSLMGIDMIVMPVHNERWNMSPGDVIEQVSMGKPGSPIPLSADGQLPKTFAFKTAQGGMGILQITELQDGIEPRHFKIRYKMLQNLLAVFVKEIKGEARDAYLPDLETKDEGVILDLASGEILKIEPGRNEEEIFEYFRLLGKGDIAYDFASNKGALITLRVGKAYNTEVINGLLNIRPLAVLREERDMCAYQLPEAPCMLYVVTGDNRTFIVEVISSDDKGINIKYGEVKMPIQRAGGYGIIPNEKTRANISEIKALTAILKSFFEALAKALDNADLNTAKTLAEQISNQLPKYQQYVKGTNVEISVTAGIALFKQFQEALAKGNVEQAKSIFESLGAMGPQIEDILETEAQKNVISRTARKVYIPDADKKDTGVILDLASGNLLMPGRLDQLVDDPNKIMSYFTELGMGDLFYDRVLGCLRGGKVSIIKPDGNTRELPVMERKGDATAYVIAPPCKLMVTTPEGDNYEVNVLNIENDGINIEYKKVIIRNVQKATVSEKTRKVYIPDADTKVTGFVLDLASGDLLTCPGNLEGEGRIQYFTVKGQGDLFYDRVLGCLRGGKVSVINTDGSTRELPVMERIGDATAYEIAPPCKLMVTTPEGDNYEVKVLYIENDGINIEYKKLINREVQKATVSEKDNNL